MKSISTMNNLLEHKGYIGSVAFSAEDNVFYGKVLGLNDSVTFEGTSVAELRSCFEESVEDYLTTCKQLGKTPEKSYKGSFNVRITPQMHQQVAQLAKIRQITLNQLVKEALEHVLVQQNQVTIRNGS